MSAIARRIQKLRKNGQFRVTEKNALLPPTSDMCALMKALLRGFNREEASALISLLVDYRGKEVVQAWKTGSSM